MRISYRWLSRHVDLSGLDAETVAADLTLSTAEVEGVERFAPQLSDVVVGRVTARDGHPDADKLSVCRVDVGSGAPLEIVCGAPNVAAGQKVAVATAGTVLPGDLRIKKTRIRGVESQGMICSARELDLGDDPALGGGGIWVLPGDAETGRPVAEALGLEDWTIEIDNKSLTHRPDLWGHRGIAAEIAAIHRRALRPLDGSLPATGAGEPFPLRVESRACRRYLGLVIEGARAEASPAWLRWLLLAVGQRPIDALVDLSNFVMLDLGQPNHLFDASRLSADGITVRQARPGEKIETLDGEERKLLPSDLLICSGDAPVALAGILGGAGSKVGSDTRRLLLEVATFDAATVRRTSARLGLRTESSARFEKSLDPTLPEKAVGHFARLLASLQPEVRFPARVSDAGDWSDPALTLELRGQLVRTSLGTGVTDADISDVLSRLGFGVRETGPGRFEVRVPSARATKDVTIEQDLVEEVGRIHRYGNIPEQTMLAAVEPPQPDPRRALVRRIQDRLAGAARFHEVLSHSFVSDALLAKLGHGELPHVVVANPIVQEEARVRRSVLPSLLPGLEANRRQSDDVRLFEIGKGYLPEASSSRGEPKEVNQAALVWASAPERVGERFDDGRFQRLLGVVEDLFAYVGAAAPRWTLPETAADRPSWAHPVRCLLSRIDGVDAPAAIVASLEPALARSLGLAGELASEVAVAEISIDALVAAERGTRPYRPLPRFPGVKLDVAVDLPEETRAAELVAVIEKAGKGQVASCELFDVYRGQNVAAGRKSLAYHIVLQSDAKTLSDQDQAKFLGRLERGLETLSAKLRR
jgi:phenylalanyl-tRNA synthetase beta chain